jgi:predicted aconitase
MNRGHCGYGHKRPKVTISYFRTFSGVPRLDLREWIMPVIATGTIVLWEVVGAPPNERVKHKSDKVVTVYITDDDNDAAVAALIAKYTLDEVDAVPAGPHHQRDQLNKAKELLNAAREGLLAATGITRATVTPPSLP